jgi:hypothetical protein
MIGGFEAALRMTVLIYDAGFSKHVGRARGNGELYLPPAKR